MVISIGKQALRTLLGIGWRPATLAAYRDLGAPDRNIRFLAKWNRAHNVVSPVRLGPQWAEVSTPSNAAFLGILDERCQVYGFAYMDDEEWHRPIRPTSSSPTRRCLR